MKSDKKIYLFLLLFAVIQIFFMSKFSVFPDLILVLVVYAAVFYDVGNVLLVSFCAGFVRGVFSPETISADLMLFPFMGAISYAMGKLFNRNNPIGGVIVTCFCVLFLIAVHTCLFNSNYANNVSLTGLFVKQWKVFILSGLAYPPVYFILNIFLKKIKYPSLSKRILY